jgi:glycine cleavage system H protein
VDVPEDLRYTEDHEWIRDADGEGVVGITAYAAEELGDIVYVELPEVGRHLDRAEVFGIIESVKTASDLFAPVSGEVMAVNERLSSSPELVNEDPYGGGWMIRLRPDDPEAANSLLDAAAYRERLGS